MTTPASRRPRRLRLTATLCAGVAAIALAHPAAAQRNWDGEVSEDWNNPENWIENALPTADFEVAINSTTSGRQPVLSGQGAVANARTVAVGQLNTGSLTVRDGAVLNIGQNFLGYSLVVGGVASNAGSAIDAARFADGTLTITGPGSRVNAVTLFMGNGTRNSASLGTEGGARGLIEVLDGGTLQFTNGAEIGAAINGANSGVGVLRVSGAGSTLEAGLIASRITIRNAGSKGRDPRWGKGGSDSQPRLVRRAGKWHADRRAGHRCRSR